MKFHHRGMEITEKVKDLMLRAKPMRWVLGVLRVGVRVANFRL
jgi:hypothetical protein